MTQKHIPTNFTPVDCEVMLCKVGLRTFVEVKYDGKMTWHLPILNVHGSCFQGIFFMKTIHLCILSEIF